MASGTILYSFARMDFRYTHQFHVQTNPDLAHTRRQYGRNDLPVMLWNGTCRFNQLTDYRARKGNRSH